MFGLRYIFSDQGQAGVLANIDKASPGPKHLNNRKFGLSYIK